MKRLAALLSLLLALAQPAAAQGPASWEAEIAEASTRFGVPAPWIRRVILIESGGQVLRNGRPIRSRVGAMGLMQVMPRTWQALRRTHRLGPDPDNPRDNILAGTAYLRAMYDRFGYPGLFAAYNAGPARYADYLARRRRLPAETRAYLARAAGVSMPDARAPRAGSAQAWRTSAPPPGVGGGTPAGPNAAIIRPDTVLFNLEPAASLRSGTHPFFASGRAERD